MDKLQSYYGIPIVALLTSISMLWLDRPIAEYSFIFSRQTATAWIWYTGNGISSVGNSTLWIIACVLLLCADRVFRNRFAPHYGALVLQCLASILAAGIMVRLLKLVTSRARPSDYFNENVYGFFWSFDKHLHSFPSGHAATIMCVAACMAMAFPRVKYGCYALAIIIASGRVVAAKHFLSDVVVGCAIGIFTTRWMGGILSSFRQTRTQS